jgi:hypothetical protein
MQMLVRKQVSLPGPMPSPEEVRIFRAMPTVISVLDYSKSFGYIDLVAGSAYLPTGMLGRLSDGPRV